MQNCILWLNNKGGSQLSGLRKQHIYHCCMYDPNDPQGSTIPDVNYNITADPKFAYLDPNNVHILFDSPCKDAGSPILNYDEQVDMDRKERVYGVAVDIGAYEIACEEIAHPLDWNADGLVNYVEFAAFSRAWLSCEPNFPGDPNNWNPACNLEQSGDSEHKIDLSDLAVFAEEAPWLWRACWLDGEDLFKQIAGGGEGMSRRGNAILANQPEPSSKQKIADLVSIIVFLEKIWLEEPDIQQEIDVQIWQEFMDSVYQGLLDLQSDDVQIE